MPVVIKVSGDLMKCVERFKHVVDAPQTKLELHQVLKDISDPYVPYNTGRLSENVTVNSDGITYHQPYARRVYYGDYMNFRKDKHPLATARWNEVAITDNEEEFNARCSDVIREAINNANK